MVEDCDGAFRRISTSIWIINIWPVILSKAKDDKSEEIRRFPKGYVTLS